MCPNQLQSILEPAFVAILKCLCFNGNEFSSGSQPIWPWNVVCWLNLLSLCWFFYPGIVAIWAWFPSCCVFKFDVIILRLGILDCLLKYPMQFTLERYCARVISTKWKNLTFFFPLDFGVRQNLISISIVPFSRLYILQQVMKIIYITVSLPVKIKWQYFSAYLQGCWKNQTT